ncbi:MAG TPA: autotransporter-associated beta strand repeat-containing protein, partial [Acidimicrobiales bacterium]|nr:autotransporter-associated beta strand repeat-containing protein [Acidimicrobiales bacterium]
SGGTTVSAGTLAVSDGAAMGTGSVTVDGELDLSGGITVGNDLTLDDATGNAIVNVSGSNTLSGNITLAAGSDIDVPNAADTLTLTGVLAGSGGVIKTSAGTLEYAGTAPDTYTGTTAVSAGMLALDVTGGTALAGPLAIGGTGTVRDLAAIQISGQPVSITGAGATLDLNDNNDMVGGLTMDGGTISLGAGTLALSTSVTINGNQGATATITGTTGSLALVASPITFDVSSTGRSSDLDIQAPLTGPGGLTKSGSGTMELDAAGTYTGTTTIGQGTLDVTASGALGTGTVAVEDPAILLIDGTSGPVSLSNALTLNSTANELSSIAGSNTLSGPITLERDASFDVVSSTLTISGAIGESGGHFGVTKIGSGTLVYGSEQANTYTGTTTVSYGELDLDSSASHGALAGPLVISDNPSILAEVRYLADNQLPSTTDVSVIGSQAA